MILINTVKLLEIIKQFLKSSNQLSVMKIFSPIESRYNTKLLGYIN